MKPTTTRRSGVEIELHGVNESVRIFREIIRLPGGGLMLGAPSTLEPGPDSPYAGVLQLADTFRPNRRQDADAKATASQMADVWRGDK